ncbi:hypothetical protein P5667_15630 [Bacillus velezensis]|uniref:hypothetical protein n=1 Tax=Bacillus velezensis TaxID=492670 RepID=UPI0027A5102A|nr:hypothetical protein [Bacillus velezensis]WEY80394.1 hypothetical protein P5667_15630 [Bacillus velezensis]
MKYIILLLVVIGLLSACSSKDTESSKEASNDNKVKETTVSGQSDTEADDEEAEKLHKKIKKESTKADFVELNVDNPPYGKKVKVEGEITNVTNEGALGGELYVSQKEGKGFGMYAVYNLTTDEYKVGDKITAYGTVESEKGTAGGPKITATLIEKK